MADTEERRFMERLFDFGAANDMDGIRSLIADDFVLYEDPGMPYGGEYRGPLGFIEIRDKVFSAWRDAKVDLLFTVEQPGDGHIASAYRMTGMFGRSAAEVTAFVSEDWLISGGKAIEARVWYYDTPTLARAFDGHPEPTTRK